jgi:hypothetical protein
MRRIAPRAMQVATTTTTRRYRSHGSPNDDLKAIRRRSSP